jgi:hypothetical protein
LNGSSFDLAAGGSYLGAVADSEPRAATGETVAFVPSLPTRSSTCLSQQARRHALAWWLMRVARATEVLEPSGAQARALRLSPPLRPHGIESHSDARPQTTALATSPGVPVIEGVPSRRVRTNSRATHVYARDFRPQVALDAEFPATGRDRPREETRALAV